MAFTPYCPPHEPPVCEPEPPCEPPPVDCEPEPPCEPPPPPVVCEPEPPVVCEPVCPPPHAGDTGNSTNTISQGGNAGNVVAGSGTYVDAGHGAGTGGGLLNLSLLNGIGGSNILSPSIGGPSVGVGAIFEQDVAGNGLLGSLFGNGGNTGDSMNTISKGGDAGDVVAGSGTYADTDGGHSGGLLNISALNGLGGSNILSPSIGGPSVGVGAIFEQDVAGNGLLGSLFGKGGDTGDSTNTVSQGGDAGNVVAGSGTYVDTDAGTDGGGLINISALNGLGGSNILSPSIGGPSVGIGAIFEQDVAGNGLLGSLFGKGGDTGDSTNTISAGGDAGDVVAGSGGFAQIGGGDDDIGSLINGALLNGVGGSNILSPSIGGPSVGIGAILEQDVAGKGLLGSLFGNGSNTGDSTNTISEGGDAGHVVAGSGEAMESGVSDVGGLINAALLNGVGGSNILSPSIGGPSLGIGAIFEQDLAGGHAYDGHIPLVGGELASALGSTLDMLTSTSSLFDVPTLDMLTTDSLDG